MLHNGVTGEERPRIAPGRDHAGVCSDDLGVPFNEADHQAADGLGGSDEHGVLGVLPDGLGVGLHSIEGDFGKGCGAAVHGSEHHADPGRDRAALERALRVDVVDGGCGADIDDDAGALCAEPRGHGAEQTILSDAFGRADRGLDGDGDVTPDPEDGRQPRNVPAAIGDEVGGRGTDGRDEQGNLRGPMRLRREPSVDRFDIRSRK